MSFLEGLNPQQLEAVTLPHQSALILAGAGSGKTRVLTTRIAWLIQTGQISPQGVLAVTFTNKAAREMLLRISAMLPINTRGMWVGTFHGLCNRILRAHYREAGLPQTFQILDSADQLAMVKRIMKSMNVDDEKYPPRQAQYFINDAKEQGLRAPKVEAFDDFSRKLVTVYLPLAIFLFVLLFPFYWMAITSVKPDAELLSREGNPFWVIRPTLAHFKKLLFDTAYPEWLWNTVLVSVVSTLFSLAASVLAAYAIERLRFRGAKQVGLSIFLAYLVPPSILFIPLAAIVFKLGLFDTRWALILTYPTFLIPFSTWLLMGYFRSIPYELEECALIDGATRWQILVRIVLPLAVPGLISAGIFAFTLSWNEFIYALTFISSSSQKTVPVAIVNEFVDGDIYRWGSLMAGALVGSLPLVVLYAFFVEHYVSAMTGAVKE